MRPAEVIWGHKGLKNVEIRLTHESWQFPRFTVEEKMKGKGKRKGARREKGGY